MNSSCVFFNIEQFKFGFEAKDVLHIEPAVALVVDPSVSGPILGFVNVSGTFGPVYDIGQILGQKELVKKIEPEQYFLVFSINQTKIAAIRLHEIPSFEKCEVIEFDDTNVNRTLRIAKLKESMVMLLSPETFSNGQMVEQKLQLLLAAFSEEIQPGTAMDVKKGTEE